jgi:hypothetical protein
LAGGAGLCFILYKLLGLIWGAIPILIIAGFALMLTFYRPNNKPLVNMLEAGFKYATQHKLYIWKRHTEKPARNAYGTAEAGGNKNEAMRGLGSRLNGSKLRDLAWSLDVLDLSKQREN